MIKENKELVAYARVLRPGVSYDESSIGRLLVIKSARGKQYGKRVAQEAINHITRNWGEKRIKIRALTYLTKFYT